MQYSAKPPKYYKGSTSDDIAVRLLGVDGGRADVQLNVRVPETPDEDVVTTAA